MSENKQVDHLVLLVGVDTEVLPIQLDSSKHYLIVDARADVIKNLEKSLSGNSQVEMIQAVVSPDGARKPFHYYSLQAFSSVLKPKKLKDYLPGLVITGSETLPSMTIPELIEPYKTVENIDIHLHVPGQELALLKSCEKADWMSKVSTIQFVGSEDEFYEGGNSLSGVVSWLKNMCFQRDDGQRRDFTLEQQTWNSNTQLKMLLEQGSQLEQIQQQLEQVLELQKNQPSNASVASRICPDSLRNKDDSSQPLVDWPADESLKPVVNAWIKSEWDTLTQLDNGQLPERENRAIYAVFAALGFQFLNDADGEQRCAALALKWGIDKAILKNIMMTGVYLRLARANVLTEDYAMAVDYFKQSMDSDLLGVLSTNKQWLRTRVNKQTRDIADKAQVEQLLSLIEGSNNKS